MEISPEICYAVLIKRKYIFIKIVFFYIVYWRYLYGTVVYLSDNKFYHSSIYHHPRAQTLVQKPQSNIRSDLEAYRLYAASSYPDYLPFVPFPHHRHADYSHFLCSSDADHYLNFSEYICQKVV